MRKSRLIPKRGSQAVWAIFHETLCESLEHGKWTWESGGNFPSTSGSACNSAGIPGSHVLKAIGLNADLVQSSLRFGLGRFTTDEEVDYAAARVMEAVRKLRNAVPRT